MLNLRKNTNVIIELFRLNALHALEYRINFISDTAIRFTEFAVFFFFWKAIFSAQASIPGWDVGSLLVLYAFQQLFIAMFLGFAVGAFDLEKEIMRGGIDKYLARPIQPWLVIMGEHSFFALGGWIVGLGALSVAHFWVGIPIFTPVFPLIVLMVGLAAIISSLFGMMMGSLAFWFGRTRLFDAIAEAIWEFDSYPITLFPAYIQTITSFTLPFLFASAVPTLVVIGQISTSKLLPYLGLELGVLLINLIVFLFIWKKGVTRYESYGG